MLCSAFVYKRALKSGLFGCFSMTDRPPDSILSSVSSDFSLASRIPYPGTLADLVKVGSYTKKLKLYNRKKKVSSKNGSGITGCQHVVE